MCGREALCGLGGWRWTLWGTPEDHGWPWTWISPWIGRWVRENRWSCRIAASYGTFRSPFTNFRAIFCTYFNACASRDRIGWVAWIAYSNFGRIKPLQSGENAGCKGREGSFQIKQHPTGFIDSADDIIFSIEHSALDNSQDFIGGNFWDCLDVGKLWDGKA